ncbi:serine/threonine protein kinase [Cyanobacterium sp. IPPAS B-1200]|uniref:serine/threonine protein kinase n=1 Tax=Cyanobacterium sp. IPPAS B-1200 TaxID=1562720 RepID=UPI0008527865|nr:serine/threonine-protein kinase [Cyanobacterium sp. IPPAS B-1200]OEJ79221.1 serine/threonine protein kinase [Cyanobacterium sp. IPPAS B-1200]
MSLGKGKQNQQNQRILADRYQLIELIGSGAMGQVYRGEDKLLGGVVVAVKFLSQTLLNDKMRHRFEREATISALLGEKSIHIIRVRDYGVDENEVPYYVMEFLEGESLSQVIKFQPLPLKRFLYLSRQICVGMDAAHSGIMLKGELCQVVHRDIKPSNVLVMQDPTLGELVKILDFGIAKLVQANATQTHSFMGTLAYCSPEQMEGKELDNRSDIYSLGVMMYEMLTLEMPILPETSSFGAWYKAHHDFKPRPFDAHLKIPQELKDVIMKCMEKSRDNRPQTVAEILRVIEVLEKDNKSNHHSPDRMTAFSGQKTIVADTYDSDDIGSQGDRTEVAPKMDLSATMISKNLTWPNNKPIQKIVFPKVVISSGQTFPSLWVMIERDDILSRIKDMRYNQFLFLNSPHPMILWITVIYNPHRGPRWLPCYLDLKSQTSRQVTAALAKTGSYKILFFAVEEPGRCQHVTGSTIASNQCKIMAEWLENSKNTPNQGDAKMSKQRLRDEFNKLKPVILSKLKNSYKS